MTTIIPRVAEAAIAKADRLFNGTLRDVLAETMQNARRAGATRVDLRTRVTEGAKHLVIDDDGRGVDDPQLLVTLGGSGWGGDIERAEDPAGMGLFALAGKRTRIMSRRAGRAMALCIEPGAWTRAAPIPVEQWPCAADEHGTAIDVELPAAWSAELERAAEAAAYHFPLPVTLDGAELKRADFLARAVRIEEWQGLRIGVIPRGRDFHESSLNFHGVTVAHPIAAVRDADGRCLHVRVDVRDCAALRLVLPARKEIVACPFVDELAREATAAIYRHMATLPSHRLAHTEWAEARALGVELPEAAAGLAAWRPAARDCDSQRPAGTADRHGPDLIVMAATADTWGEHCFARALGAAPALEARLVEPLPAFAGYAWYDRLTRLTRLAVEAGRETGERLWPHADDGDAAAQGPDDFRCDWIRWKARIEPFGKKARHIRLEGDVLIVPDEDTWSDDPAEALTLVARSSALSPDELAGLFTNIMFCASDDREADSWYTQHERFTIEALDHARRVLLTPRDAALARLWALLSDAVKWHVPPGMALRASTLSGTLTVELLDEPEPEGCST